MQEANVKSAVSALIAVRQDRNRIDLLPEAARPATIAEAYKIQAASIPAILEQAGGGRAVGYKCGATNEKAMAGMKLPEPFRAVLLSPFVHDSPADIPSSQFFMRALESEYAFRMASDLTEAGATYSMDAVRDAVAAVMPAIEIVDSRYTNWSGVGGINIIADQGAAGHWVKGAEVTDLSGINFESQTVTLTINGEVRETGTSAMVLGNPLKSLTWIANDLVKHGGGLKAGDLVTTGTCTPVVMAEAGDRAAADFGPLGHVDVQFG